MKMAQPFESQPVSHLGDSDSDLDSLFGDGLDNDVDLSSLLFEEGTSHPAIDLPPATSTTEPVCELTLPRVQEGPVFQLTLPVVPDPLGAPLSHQDGHTSGGLVVSSTQSPHNEPLSAGAALSGEFEFPSDDVIADTAALHAELSKLLEADWASHDQDQHVNAPTDASEDGPHMIPTPEGESMEDSSVIYLHQVHGLRYSQSASTSAMKLPRRIDDDTQLAKVWEFITLRRSQKYEELYSLLELPVGEGKYLKKDLHEYLEAQQFADLIQEVRCDKKINPAQTKMFVVKLAYQILAKEGWGVRWFGAQQRSSNARTLLWPEDSTTLLFYFAMFVYRVQDNLKSRVTQQNSLARRKRDNTSTRTSTPSSFSQSQIGTPETECPSDNTSTTPHPPRTPRPCTPPDGHIFDVQALWESTDLVVTARKAQRVAQQFAQLPTPPAGTLSPTLSIRQTREPSQPEPARLEPEVTPGNGQSFFASLVSEVTVNKKRKWAKSLAGLQDQDIYEVEIPPNAKLTYHIFVKDGTDSSDLIDTPFEFKHTDSIISEGAFEGLMASFEQAQYRRPHMWIQTPYGRRIITTTEEWDQAVLSIYNLRRAGGVVEIDVFV